MGEMRRDIAVYGREKGNRLQAETLGVTLVAALQNNTKNITKEDRSGLLLGYDMSVCFFDTRNRMNACHNDLG